MRLRGGGGGGGRFTIEYFDLLPISRHALSTSLRFTIEYFDQGLLGDVEKGTSLRAYLAGTLNCDPMRISKKFAGAQRIGKRFFRK